MLHPSPCLISFYNSIHVHSFSIYKSTFVVIRPQSEYPLSVRATAPELAGDPKFRYITNQLVDNTHLAGDPKKEGCRSLLGWGIINLNMEIMEIINNKVG